MTTIINDPLADVEQTLGEFDANERGSNRHEGLRRLFARLGTKLVELGDVIVFVDGQVAPFDAFASPARIVEFARKDPATHCAFRLPWDGPPRPLMEGEKLETGDQFVVSLCTPPADGADRKSALARDIATLRSASRSVRMTRLREGQDALLADFQVQPGDMATCGVVVGPQYPATGPDWFLLDTRHEMPGFTGGRRGPFHEGDLPLVEYSIHPPPGHMPSAAGHVISIVARRLPLVRRSLAG